MSEAIGADSWAGAMGERWLANVDSFESMLGQVGAASLAHAGFRAGERVIDVGCGGGATTRAIARAVGPTGGVLGLDISAPLIVEARQRAARESLPNVGFIAQDAATASPPGVPFERLYSRFGSMFFPDPAAAFANLHTFVQPRGRVDFAVWAPPQENAWVSEMMAIAREHLDLPKPPPHAPGPFALDDPDWFGGLLEGAGFRELHFHKWQGLTRVGGQGQDAAGAADFVLLNSHFGDQLREGSAELQASVRTRVTAAFKRYQGPEGVDTPAAAFFVSARA